MNTTTLTSMLTTAAGQLGIIYDIVGVLCYLGGILCVCGGLFSLAKVGAGKSEGLMVPFASLLTGFLLLAIPTTINLSVSIVTGQSAAGSVYGYQMPSSISAQAQPAVQAFMAWVQFIGILAIIRGVTLIKKAAAGGHNHGLGSVAIFIICGALAANITFTIGVLQSLFGISTGT